MDGQTLMRNIDGRTLVKYGWTDAYEKYGWTDACEIWMDRWPLGDSYIPPKSLSAGDVIIEMLKQFLKNKYSLIIVFWLFCSETLFLYMIQLRILSSSPVGQCFFSLVGLSVSFRLWASVSFRLWALVFLFACGP